MEGTDITEQITPEMKQEAATAARDRAVNARWDLNIAIFLFAVLIIVIILLFQEIGIEVVAPVAVFGLSMVWLVGWKRGNELYRRYYEEELAKKAYELKRALKEAVKETIEETVEETIEERVQRALRERWR